jgi:hypothetical protein
MEARALEVIDVSPLPRALPAVIEHAYEPDIEVQRLIDASRTTREAYLAQRKKKMARLRGWGILGAVMILPFAAAAALPDRVVSYAPAAIKAYEALGIDVNIYGLELRHIEEQHTIADGTRVLSVKGEIANVSGSTAKIPWLRFALTDASGKEVYKWTLDTASRPLRPGESTSFVTRVAAPPEASKNLQIRFAHLDEVATTPAP